MSAFQTLTTNDDNDHQVSFIHTVNTIPCSYTVNITGIKKCQVVTEYHATKYKIELSKKKRIVTVNKQSTEHVTDCALGYVNFSATLTTLTGTIKSFHPMEISWTVIITDTTS